MCLILVAVVACIEYVVWRACLGCGEQVDASLNRRSVNSDLLISSRLNKLYLSYTLCWQQAKIVQIRMTIVRCVGSYNVCSLMIMSFRRVLAILGAADGIRPTAAAPLGKRPNCSCQATS